MRTRLRGINTVRKTLSDGSTATYYYHRATGRRIQGEPATPAFLLSYAEAEKLSRERLNGTFNGLIRAYTLSPEFAKRASSTQKEYRRMLTKAEAAFGDMPIAALEDPRVRQDFLSWRAKVARDSGEREADNRLTVISAMLSWAIENGRIFRNNVSGFKRLHKSNRSDMIWLPEHVAAFMKVAPIEMQRALILALHTGQRQGDLLRLTWPNYDGQFVTLKQGKGGRQVSIPCTAALRGMLDNMDRSSVVILSTKTGLSYKSDYFKARWADASKAAGIEGLHFHDLRGTAVTMLAEAGCTHMEIASITGHSLKSVATILDRYLARTRTLATGAMTKFENAKSTEFANRLQTEDRPAPRANKKV
ncbi:tyrosine-type recombinase/integrase [Arsenicitalea aurantiaca]|uniref:tyrosine-type recombinase/integrase n=1 Tax=Arsenicitalea aurantiaca TaxID=1783274 RepID=UPI001FCE66DC|nr:tyrosine-type recombinase/integrase [Arsenicitalea aurantiaca]